MRRDAEWSRRRALQQVRRAPPAGRLAGRLTPGRAAARLEETIQFVPDGEEDEQHYRTSRHLGEVLGIRGGSALPPSVSAHKDGEEDERHYRTSRHLGEVLGIRGGSALPPSVLGIRGGAALHAAPLFNNLWPLIQQAELPVRVALMSWTVYDKFRRSLKLFVPKPFLEECQEFFRIVAGVELHALEAMKEFVQSVEHLRPNHPDVQKAHVFALQHLAEEMERGARESADSALQVGKGTFQKVIKHGKHCEKSVRHEALRIADAVKQDKNGNWKADGKFFDLRGRALRDAAEIDVTDEIVPERVQGKTRLKLLGLIASLGHNSVFKKVQESLGHDEKLHGPALTIEQFKEKMGVDSAADLVKRLIHKYSTPKSFLHAYIVLYTISHLRSDPRYFQISWGVRLATLFASSRSKNPMVHHAADRGLFFFHSMEANVRGQQLVEFAKMAQAGAQLSTWDQLQAANCFLTVLLFFAGKTDHPAFTMDTVYDVLASNLMP